MSQELPQDLFAGKFRLLRLLGKGAMGEVWLAEEVGPRNFRRQVAVKRLLATDGISEYARESFIAEAQVIARLDHPNIVRLIELGESDERGLYLVLDYIDGAALDRLMRKTGPLSPAAVALIGREVARALDAVHSMTDGYGQNLGVVHRDVSPANILIGRDGRVRLSDFGVARIHGLGGEKTETGIFKGKLPYMPPEQALGEPFDGRADVFSLGVTIFEALIGGRLRKAETQGQLIAKIATERVIRVHDVVPDTIPALAHAIDAATEFRSHDRIPSAGHLASALNGVLFAMGPSAEQNAYAELADRVNNVAGASTGPTTKQPWSLALSGEVPGFGASGSNPRAFTGSGPMSTGSGPYSVPAPPTSNPSNLYGTESGPLSSPHSGSGGYYHAQLQTRPGVASVPPDGAPSVTRIASISDATRPKPTSRAWMVALGLAALLGVGAGTLWVVFGFDGSSSRTTASTATTNEREPPPASSAVVEAPPPEPTSSSEVAMTDTSSTPTSSSNPKDPTQSKTRPTPTPRPTTTPTSDPGEEATGNGTLQVTVSPWGNVTVDGVPRGTTPIGPITLSAGNHTVSVTNPDLGASRSATIKVVPGKQASIGFDLRKSQ